jgi:hypothetical protein
MCAEPYKGPARESVKESLGPMMIAMPASKRIASRASKAAALLLLAGLAWPAAGQTSGEQGRPIEISPTPRIAQLIQANDIATHAFQVLLAKKTGRGSPDCYTPGTLTDGDLQALVEHQRSLLATDSSQIKAWTEGQKSSFDPASDLDPILMSRLVVPQDAPVSVITAYLQAKTQGTRTQIHAIANLFQTVLEIDRDGDLLQDEFQLYINLGVPVFLGRLTIDGSDEAFLEAGRELSPRTCASPFDTSPAAWQIAFRKIWNWGEKKLHIRDEWTIARQLLREADVSALIPAMKAMPAQRIAVIGHSFTMGAHWSSPSSFVPIVSAMFELENPGVVFRQFYAGGLTASRAYREFCQNALEWKPDKVLLVVLMRGEEDYHALARMGERFRDAGSQCYVFDNIHDPEADKPGFVGRFVEAASADGFTVIEVDKILSNAPDRGAFVCLDSIHMTEPYHRLMAREWLKFLTGARPAAIK